MARQPMVTRTIKTTKCQVLCLDLVNEQPITKEIILPRTYKDEKHMMKVISKLVDDEAMKAVHVQSFENEETLYGMTEIEFINAAHILPSRK